jgi:hypothetical protein
MKGGRTDELLLLFLAEITGCLPQRFLHIAGEVGDVLEVHQV